MGATFPLAMAGIRIAFSAESSRSFSYLYLANVLGAMCGTICSAFVFIELLGFSKTLLVAAGLNVVIAAAAFTLARGKLGSSKIASQFEPSRTNAPILATDSNSRIILPLLFASGAASLGMEVVWT